jgi:hypothetical protein
MRKQVLGALLVCAIGVPALAGDDLSGVSQSRPKIGSMFGSVREKIKKSRAERAERALTRPPLFSRTRAALAGAGSKMGLQPKSDGPIARLTQGNPVRPWKSSIPIQKFW